MQTLTQEWCVKYKQLINTQAETQDILERGFYLLNVCLNIAQKKQCFPAKRRYRLLFTHFCQLVPTKLEQKFPYPPLLTNKHNHAILWYDVWHQSKECYCFLVSLNSAEYDLLNDLKHWESRCFLVLQSLADCLNTRQFLTNFVC